MTKSSIRFLGINVAKSKQPGNCAAYLYPARPPNHGRVSAQMGAHSLASGLIETKGN